MPHIVEIALILIFVLLTFFFFNYFRMVKNLRSSLRKLSRSFQELDEQAKLIVQTDLELNKAQETLDKRLSGLDALHTISRMINASLIEDEIFHRLSKPLLTELGFEKFIIFIVENDQLSIKVNFGYPNDEGDIILNKITGNQSLQKELCEKQLISSLHASPQAKQSLLEIFSIQHFVTAPLSAQHQSLGFVFAGNTSNAYPITEGDEEVISIFADQVAGTLRNAKLFEQVYKSSQELEMKIQNRTLELSQALEEVQRISKTKSEFISAVSHELRTPLTSIKGYASILMTGKVGAIPDKVKERLEKINKHTDNLVSLINNLLDISRIESGRVEMKFLEHDIPSIIQNVHDLLLPQLKDKNLHLIEDLAEGLPLVMIDVNQIERVFINIISNAIKFTLPSGKITVRATHDRKEILVSIADNGIGIKDEDLPKLFNEFYRVDNAVNQNLKGTGLGLALVKKIIEAHGGRIWVSSRLNVGTTFFFTIPFQDRVEPPPQK